VGEKVSDELLKIEYEKGYSDAVLQLEKSLEDEKAYLRELSANLFTIKGEISEELRKLIIEKIHQISMDFLGEKIDVIPQTLLDKIMASVEHISSYLETVVVELNELDALAINSNVTALEDYAFKIKVDKDLKRGEFKITDGDTLYAKFHS
jgi:flagellar biosynthesis/type III secretory pathway protein FliH